MLDDQIPWQNHDAERICQELLQAVAELACSGILLDFEREPCQQTQVFCTLLCTLLPTVFYTRWACRHLMG